MKYLIFITMILLPFSVNVEKFHIVIERTTNQLLKPVKDICSRYRLSSHGMVRVFIKKSNILVYSRDYKTWYSNIGYSNCKIYLRK